MKPFKLAFLSLVSASLLAACGGSNDDSFDDRADIADPKLRFVHAAQLAPAFTLFRNGAVEGNATGSAYTYASQYYDIGTGQTGLSLRLASNTATVVEETAFAARRGNKYTLVALPSADGADLLLIDDPYNRSLTSNDARVRVVNASVNASNVDVYLTAAGVDIAAVTPSIPAVPFKEPRPASTNDSIELAGGAYVLRITTAGTKSVIFTANVNFAQNEDWLLLTLPTDGAGGVLPGAIKVLGAKADDSTQASVEIVSQ